MGAERTPKKRGYLWHVYKNVYLFPILINSKNNFRDGIMINCKQSNKKKFNTFLCLYMFKPDNG